MMAGQGRDQGTAVGEKVTFRGTVSAGQGQGSMGARVSRAAKGGWVWVCCGLGGPRGRVEKRWLCQDW